MPPKTKQPTVALVAVVKDEAAVLARMVESVRPVIASWTVVDTGSADDTPELVKELLGDLEGGLYRRPWIGFGHNKTEALQLAHGTADRLLVLDADMTIEGSLDGCWTAADALMVAVRDRSDFQYRLPLLISGSRPWRFEGVTHEYLDCAQPTTRENIDSLTVTHHCDGARRPDKLYSDLVLLTAELARNPADPRTVFYLAQTHRDLGNLEQAIVLYRMRAEMGGWPEEAYYARYQLGCLLAANVSFARGARELLQAWEERPDRVEALTALANAANSVADKTPLPDDVLFVHRDQYRSAA